MPNDYYDGAPPVNARSQAQPFTSMPVYPQFRDDCKRTAKCSSCGLDPRACKCKPMCPALNLYQDDCMNVNPCEPFRFSCQQPHHGSSICAFNGTCVSIRQPGCYVIRYDIDAQTDEYTVALIANGCEIPGSRRYVNKCGKVSGEVIIEIDPCSCPFVFGLYNVGRCPIFLNPCVRRAVVASMSIVKV